jgi:uncharacterized protein YkvS
MKDIRSFVKLFDLHVPSYEDFDYYKNQYAKLNQWKNIDELVKMYEQAESEIEDIFAYKIAKVDEVVNFLKGTRAYNELNDDNLIPDLPVNKNFEFEMGKKYVSIDLKMANWQVLKKYDPDFINELGDTYSDLLNKFNIHPIFHQSKHFRQYIFGNVNPKRQVRAQRVMIQDLINALSNHNLKVEFIKWDEVIYSYDNVNQIKFLEEIDSDLFRVKLFSVKLVDDFRIHTYYDFSDNEIDSEIVGCNGHKYFILLKKWILNEPLDIRDLYFRNDGDLAIWNIDGLKISL